MNIIRWGAVVMLVSVAAACTAADRVEQEIARLEQTLNGLEANKDDLPKDVHDLFASHRAALERARKASSPEYRLYRLRDAFVGIETLAFAAREKSAGASVAELEKLWRRQEARFGAKAPRARGSLLQRALIESAETRAGRLYRASLPYAKASAPWSGVYYLGEGEANLRFRDFLVSIADGDEKGATRERVAAMLADLDRDTLAFFGKDVTNQALVPVSVRLKEAHELLDAGRVDGATLLLVEARAALSRRGGPRGTYPPQTVARTGSIVSVLQAWAEDEQAPMSGALREEVVPFYGALFAAGGAPSRARPAQVTVTLVRWPYT
ncbi:MAG TPA: hypothetical protein VM733_05050 [Thermoanaerobaculia bacterium]|nr:hypothetical protein [Thermoanaerobaculia bacterium]